MFVFKFISFELTMLILYYVQCLFFFLTKLYMKAAKKVILATVSAYGYHNTHIVIISENKYILMKISK